MNAKSKLIAVAMAYMAVVNVADADSSLVEYSAESLASTINSSGIVAISFEVFPGPDGEYGTPDDEPTPICGTDPLSICSFSSSNYSNNQVVFSSGTPFQGGFFPGSDSSNHYISSTPLIANFTSPISGISVTSYSSWTAILYAFDALNNVIASDVLTNTTQGNEALLGTLKVSTHQPIAYFKVLAEGCPLSANTCDRILNLDNLILTVSPPTLIKTCSIINLANQRDTISVPQSWTAATCNQYKMAVRANNYQLGCIFDDSFSFGVRGGGKPSPNCGW
jgi:hypothetical protein